MGAAAQNAHDDRYDMAAEYLEVVYRLWEGSWEDGAVARDRATGCSPTRPRCRGLVRRRALPRRRHPLVRAVAAADARAVPGRFVAARAALRRRPRRVRVRRRQRPSCDPAAVAQLREDVAAAGREPADVVVCSMISVIVDETERAAQDRATEYASYASADGALALLSGWSGKDYARPLDDQTSSEAIEAAARTQPRDIDAAARHVALAGSCPLVVGSPDHVADELESLREDTGVDGFNVTRQVMPESFVDFVDLVVPELQRRGVLKRAYAPGTLREKLFGHGAHLQPPHPAAAHRRWSSSA